MQVRVSDIGSNFEENLQRWARSLGIGKVKRQVFLTIYSGKKARWSIQDIADRTGLNGKDIASAGKQMSVNGLFDQIDGARVIYQKIPEIHHNKKRVLKYAGSVSDREGLPTKRNSGNKQELKMSSTTNNFNNVGVANTGTLSGHVTGNSQHIDLSKEAHELMAALNRFKIAVQAESSFHPDQRDDAANAVEDLKAEVAKPVENRNMSRVRNAVLALKGLATGTEAVRKIYEQLHPFVSAHFHLSS